MDDEARRDGSWSVALLHLACCGGPLLAIAGAAALPALWVWVTTEAYWLIPATAILLLSGYAMWRRSQVRRCSARPAEPAPGCRPEPPARWAGPGPVPRAVSGSVPVIDRG